MSAAALSAPTVIHITFALAALILGPFALASRKGSRLHRALGYGWVTLMLGAAISSLFIHGGRLPNIAGYGPIHLLSITTLFSLGAALWFASRHKIRAHRMFMIGTYVSGCIGAGLFTLLPSRYLGDLLWRQTLALI